MIDDIDAMRLVNRGESNGLSKDVRKTEVSFKETMSS